MKTHKEVSNIISSIAQHYSKEIDPEEIFKMLFEYQALRMEWVHNELRHMINVWRKEKWLDIQLRIWCYCSLAQRSFYTWCTAIWLPLPMIDTDDVVKFTFEWWEARVLIPDNRYDHIDLSEYELNIETPLYKKRDNYFLFELQEMLRIIKSRYRIDESNRILISFI